MPWKIVRISQNYLWTWVKSTWQQMRKLSNILISVLQNSDMENLRDIWNHVTINFQEVSKKFCEMLPNFQRKYFNLISGLTSFHFLKYGTLIDAEQKAMSINTQSS